MLSQLTKTIKMALKSTEEERAILRARSALQRFPVVEWRQRMEDFHKRSINTSRALAGPNAWRESDCDGGGVGPMPETDDWDPVNQTYPSQPDWDSRSMNEYSRGSHIPGSPGQWSQETLSTTGDNSNMVPPRLLADGHRSSFATDGGDEDYFSHSRASTADSPGGYNDFLERANRTIARDQRHAPDPFLEAPARPFGAHSRVSSVESIASIVDEKSNSPLNKAIASVSLVCVIRPLCCTDNIPVYGC